MTQLLDRPTGDDDPQPLVPDDLREQRAEILAKLIFQKIDGVGQGHCARVDYLDRQEAEAVCQALRELADQARADALDTFVLDSKETAERSPLAITSDRAIELRNRKLRPLCLFIPPDVVDAAASSLANSFAEIDGRALYREGLKATDPLAAEQVRRTARILTGRAKPSDRDLLDFVIAARELAKLSATDQLGRELWRIGLIADGGGDFTVRLDRNKATVAKIARPLRPSSSARDRLATTKVDAETARRLERFFDRRSPTDVRSWSRALLDEHLTFDQWIFPEEVTSDLTGVTVTPFLNKQGALDRSYQKVLSQPDGAGTPLFLPVGEKAKLSAKWKTEPAKSLHVEGWRVSFLPAGQAGSSEAAFLASLNGDEDVVIDLPSHDVKGSQRSASFTFDLEPDELPSMAIVPRVVAIDASGAEVRGEDGEPIAAVGDEFYFSARTGGTGQARQTERRRTVPNLAEGKLRAALETKANITRIELTQPRWTETSPIAYFTASVDARTHLSVALSALLLGIERQTLDEARSGGRWCLTLDEVRAADLSDVGPAAPIEALNPAWEDFWKARSAFFERIRPRPGRGTNAETDPGARNIIEVAEWTAEQVNGVLRYAQAYRSLLTSLAGPDVSPDELHQALTIDTLSISLELDQTEPAVVVLPTHPLRALWLASHHELLRTWEERALDEIPKTADRKRNVHLDLIQDLRPINMPAFAYGVGSDEPYVFFRNLGFAHGVALPAAVPDPLRRFIDLSVVLGFGEEPVEADDRSPERLAKHLDRFSEIHPYADPLQIALVNPDQGELLASALEQSTIFHPGNTTNGDEDDGAGTRQVPLLEVTGYVLGGMDAALVDLERLRTRQAELTNQYPVDHLHPRLMTAVRPVGDVQRETSEPEQSDLAAAHVAILSDLCKPRVAVAEPLPDEEQYVRSISLYGLISRIHGELESSEDAANGRGFRWRYRVANPSVAGLEEHPAKSLFSTRIVELQSAILQAIAHRLDPSHPASREPVLEVTLEGKDVRLLEWFHQNADWVITVDRFFGIDYFDSPNEPGLERLAEKHVIDYTPEFIDGLGHRVIVTTAWRDEIQSILNRAVSDVGFTQPAIGVPQLLRALKSVSGRLALQVLRPEASAAKSVGLAATVLWLKETGRLKRSIVIPVDAHPELFAEKKEAATAERPRKLPADLLLIDLHRGYANLTLVAAECRTDPLTDVEGLVDRRQEQLQSLERTFTERFFKPDRIDAPLHRAHLGNIMRFYAARAERYGLLDTKAANEFRKGIMAFEKDGSDARPQLEEVVVCLNDPGRQPYVEDDFRFTVLNAASFERLSTTSTATTAKIDTPQSGQPSGEKTDPIRPSGNDQVEDANDGSDDTGRKGKTDLVVTGSKGDDGRPQNSEAGGRDVRVVLGQGPAGDVVWTPSVQGSPHLFITGIPGQGKSVTTKTLLHGLAEQGVPSLVFDFHGEYAEDASTWTPKTGPLSTPLIVDADEGLPFSPFEVDPNQSRNRLNATAQSIAEIFGYVCDLGPIQQGTLMEAIREAYHARGLRDDQSLEDYPPLPSMGDVRRRLERFEQRGDARNVLVRCRPLLELDVFRPPEDGSSAFGEALKRGLVVRLDHLSSEVAQNAVGAFLLRKVYRDMFVWGRTDHLRLAVILDEAHRLAKDTTLPKLLKEGRKYGVFVIAASQGLSDFHPDVLGNVGTKVAFRANYPESRKVAGFFTAADHSVLPEKIERLQVAHALVQTPEMRQAFTVEMTSALGLS